MAKNIFNIFLALAFTLSAVFTTVSMVEKKSFDPFSEAKAQVGNCEGSIEITAGQTGSISASYYNYFSGNCQTGTIDGYGPTGLSFNQVYMGTDYCSNGWSVSHYETTAYNATSVNISSPYTFVASVYGYVDTGGECEMVYDSVEITVIPASNPDFTMTCTPASTTIGAGSSTSYNISSTSQDGFNSPVAFSHSLSPAGGTLPTISYTGNNQVPPATTTANVTTTASTTPATYTITFTGTGGGKTHTCNVNLTVTAAAPPVGSYALSISPISSNVLRGNTAQFTVSATCSGSSVGPIFGLTASSLYANLTYSFSSTTVACGGSVTLTVGNTNSISGDQYSTPQTRLGQNLTVTGSGQ